MLTRFTERRGAIPALAVAAVLCAAGLAGASQLRVGDLDRGAPELRPDSVYNRDVAFMSAHYAASSDVFAVMVKTPDGECSALDTVTRVDALDWRLRQVPGVIATDSLALLNRNLTVGLTEGNPKWYELIQNKKMMNLMTSVAPRGLYNDDCNLLTVNAYLTDHQSDTLTRVVNEATSFARVNDDPHATFLLAAGNAGIEAATNIVVEAANHRMLLLVYLAVTLLCLITFRSWRAVLCAIVPLVLTSILAEALMVQLHIGLKVATLPVIALGVGIGVDYSLYLMTVVLAGMRNGLSLPAAYGAALRFTGRVVLLTGITLAAGVATWTFSPIKFQADLGVLLAFMFLWNMLGALILLPALAAVLLRTPAAGVIRNQGFVGHGAEYGST